MASDSPAPGTLAEALAALQGQLPRVAKTADAQYGKYADLTVVTEAIMPVLSALGLAFTARPTLIGDGDSARFVLAYTLHFAGGGVLTGEYPLPSSGSPQQVGAAITYARRYALCAVTGLAPGDDDDDAQSAEAAHHEARKSCQVPDASLAAEGRMTRAQKSEHERLAADTVRTDRKAERSHPRAPDPDDPWAQDAPVDGEHAAALRGSLLTDPEDKPGSSTFEQQQKIAIELAGKGITAREDKLVFCGHVTGRDIGSSKELSLSEAQAVLRAVRELEDANA